MSARKYGTSATGTLCVCHVSLSRNGTRVFVVNRELASLNDLVCVLSSLLTSSSSSSSFFSGS